MNRSVVFLVVLLASKGYSQEHHLILNHRLWRIQEQHELNQSEFDEKVAKGIRAVVQHAPGFLEGYGSLIMRCRNLPTICKILAACK